MSTSEPAKKPTILETIYAQRRKDVDIAKSTAGTSPQDLDALLALHLAPPLISFVERLKRNPSSRSKNPSPSLMAEIKRASPSKGPIAMSANAAQQALTYALAGASVISVLTEPTWFKGSLLDLRLARQAVEILEDRPAFLRKEFILDEYQIAEARLYGADTILLIVAMLSPERLTALYTYSLTLGMEPLVEVNNATEMALALELGAKVIGVNNRNLHDFQVDMGTTSRLVDMVRDRDVILCALSGISSSKDVQIYNQQGVRGVLIGEALMRAEDTSKFIHELLQWPEPISEAKEKVWVMVSGVLSAAEAVEIASQGADILGLIFDSSSTRNISVESATSITSALLALSSESSRPQKSGSPTPLPWFAQQKRNLQAISRNSPVRVGIFREKSLREILDIISVAKLDLADVDSVVPDSWIQYIPVPVIRRFTLDNAKEISRPGLHSFAVLDQPKTSTTEANSEFFNGAVKLIKNGEATNWNMPIILGNLSTQNAHAGVQAVQPWAVEIVLNDGESNNYTKLIQDIKAC